MPPADRTIDVRDRIPDGPLAEKWSRRKDELKLVSPNNRRRYTVLVVGSGLAGGSAAATLADLGYNVVCFCSLDSPRRAHSIAAQGGINAAKNYQNDGDSVFRMFHDTLKGGDFRAREANVYRLAELSAAVIDECIAQGVPFAREYGGLLANRSFGGVQVQRTFYARGQTGQQLLLGVYAALNRQIAAGRVTMRPRTEMLDLVLHEGRAVGLVTRDLRTGQIDLWKGDAVVLATGGYCNAYYLSTNAKGCNVSAVHRAWRRGALVANPSFTQIHPTCLPPMGAHQAKLTLMSESLRNDGRIWVPKRVGETRPANDVPEDERDYYLERKYPSYGNLAPRDISSRSAKEVCDAGHGVGYGGKGVYLDFRDAIARVGKDVIRDRYGNLFDMYERITGEDPYEVPMRIFPAAHFTMGGLWVDYDLMSNVPGLFVLGEANFSDHGANRLGANSLLQGLVDGYFVAPLTIGNFLAEHGRSPVDTDHSVFRDARSEVEDRTRRMLALDGSRTVDSFHRELGDLMWDRCGISRTAEGLADAIDRLGELRERFWREAKVVGGGGEVNPVLEHAGRTADFLEFAEVMCRDALLRDESCGAHLREEHQTDSGEAVRNDDAFQHVACWRHAGENAEPKRLVEPLVFETVQPRTRSYV